MVRVKKTQQVGSGVRKDLMVAVDVGNTTIGVALMRGLVVVEEFRIDSVDTLAKMAKEFGRRLKGWKKFKPSKAVVCSVVPRLTSSVEKILRKSLDVPVAVVGRETVVPMANRYQNPKQVGADRLVGAYAVWQLYGAPSVVVDFGTAITFDMVSAKGEYLGGMIVPGLRLSAESLSQKTALLPEIVMAKPKMIIGRTTEASILSGLYYGYGSLCEGVVQRIREQFKKDEVRVVLTGGHAPLMKQFFAEQDRIVDEDLVFRGLALLV